MIEIIGQIHRIKRLDGTPAIAVPCRGAESDNVPQQPLSPSTQPCLILVISRTQPTARGLQMTLKPLFFGHSPGDSCCFISPRSLLVGCCLALDPFGTGALFFMLQVSKGVAILPPCQLGNMRSDGHLLMRAEYCSYGHGHEVYLISSQFSPFQFFFSFCTCINQLSVQNLLVNQISGTIALG